MASRAILGRFFSSGSLGNPHSTIFALTSGGIRCAVAVIRVSGPQSNEVLRKIGRFKSLPQPRMATLRKLYDPTSHSDGDDRFSVIDHGLVLWFPGPNSFTGEDCCEFQVHGGPSIITSLVRSIGNLPDCRMAEPGEFTRRAFLNGKMDLTEVEGLGDLIAAETEMQRTQALNQMSGSLKRLYESWRGTIAKCLANAEAYIDFGEDENIEDDIMQNIDRDIRALIAEIKLHLKDQKKGQRLRNGVRIAILGKPNAGKSSLLNLICRREAAIVSNVPGTTRDVVESCINLQGFPVIIADTAGIRAKPRDDIEFQGIKKSLNEAKQADLLIFLVESSAVDSPTDDVVKTELLHLLQQTNENSKENIDFEDLISKTIVVVNKVDLAQTTKFKSLHRSLTSGSRISCKTNEGIDDFLQLLTGKVSDLCADPKFESPFLTQERYRSHLENCIESLTEYIETFDETSDLALRVYCLRKAINNIGYITGHFGTEQILDIIFKEFCIGK